MMLQEFDTIKWSTTNTTKGLQGQKSLQPRNNRTSTNFFSGENTRQRAWETERMRQIPTRLSNMMAGTTLKVRMLWIS